MTEENPELKIIVKGFDEKERRFLMAAVKLSKRRQPALEMIADNDIDAADLVVIDGLDSKSVVWSKINEKKIGNKPVLWIDAEPKKLGHGKISRPVLWVNFPIIIARVLEEASLAEVTNDVKEAPVTASVESPEIATESNAPKILVVDDSPAIRDHLIGILERNQYRVHAVDSGESALSAMDNQDFDCTLMDVLMPGMDGYEACKKIKTRKKKTPVIMLTGKSSPFNRIRGKMAGCDAYLTKPVNVEKLQKALDGAIAR